MFKKVVETFFCLLLRHTYNFLNQYKKYKNLQFCIVQYYLLKKFTARATFQNFLHRTDFRKTHQILENAFYNIVFEIFFQFKTIWSIDQKKLSKSFHHNENGILSFQSKIVWCLEPNFFTLKTRKWHFDPDKKTLVIFCQSDILTSFQCPGNLGLPLSPLFLGVGGSFATVT